MASDEIDYKIIGDDLQAVIITLDPGAEKTLGYEWSYFGR